MKPLILLFFSLFSLLSCGVKGKPLPPENPREIGIGKPQYKGVDKELNRNNPDEEDEKKKTKETQ